MPVESCTQSLCDLALRFGEDDEDGGMVSPAPTCSLALGFVPTLARLFAEGASLLDTTPCLASALPLSVHLWCLVTFVPVSQQGRCESASGVISPLCMLRRVDRSALRCS